MSEEELENKSNYFFHKSLKDILRNNEKPLFSLGGSDSHVETDNSSKPGQNSKSPNEKTCSESLGNNKKTNIVELRSWKEPFFFFNNDNRLKDGVLFFKCVNNQNNLQYNEVRKKLKQSIRHKMSKRRNLAVKKKFNKKNFKQFMYKKIK
ncbi:unnamed protein product [Nezara viridula]|uniref:Uncharacterized protein n=1 Tax=Nezara viridula TaxID=85310 RepID=A0A9P0GZ48_NEZVI|nr:unnamed protein product [Nezara viridula]